MPDGSKNGAVSARNKGGRPPNVRVFDRQRMLGVFFESFHREIWPTYVKSTVAVLGDPSHPHFIRVHQGVSLMVGEVIAAGARSDEAAVPIQAALPWGAEDVAKIMSDARRAAVVDARLAGAAAPPANARPA